MKGRTIRVFLADGVPDGMRTSEIMNWTGKLLVFSQLQLGDFLRRPEARRTGVYMLVGENPDDASRPFVYVGESDDVGERLKQHAKDDRRRESWTQTVVVVSKDENLSKAHVRFLESQLIALTRRANTSELANGNAGAPTTLAESDVADMEFFLAQIQLLLPVLGFTFTQPRSRQVVEPIVLDGTGQDAAGPSFTLKVGRQSATAVSVGGAFIVKRGSYLQAAEKPSIGRSHREERARLLTSGTVVVSDQPEYWQFSEDVAFDSPSAAASVIQGVNVNGRIAWTAANGVTYGTWQDAQLVTVTYPEGAADNLPTQA